MLLNRTISLPPFFTGILMLLLLCLCGCQASKKKTLFQKLSPEQTGIQFSNTLAYDKHFNIYTYRNFYNGGGVAIGDVNGDGKPDIFFTANMGPNKLYLNKGNFQFEDVTEKAGIGKKGKWSTGVSLADVNGDGKLDIYVCNSGDVKGDRRENELYINEGTSVTGVPMFTEKAAEYGIADRGLSTHAAFFDFDRDGDLDLFLLNNSFKAIGSFNLQQNERNIRDSLGGHKFFRNDLHSSSTQAPLAPQQAAHFTDISEQAGIYGSVIGFGLGVTVGDVNGDGWQDIYVSNDFFERDYLYLNRHDGTFEEALEKQMMSISNASMGADMADINNDGRPDIFVTEMLPGDEARLKTNITFENWDKYQLDLKYDYHHQFTRNMLQLNNGRPRSSFGEGQTSGGEVSFSEIGRFAGVAATDWSWGALIADFDNDGYKDIFVANGIYQDLTNQDYIQYISNERFFREVASGKADYRKMIDLIPSHAVSNVAFSNNGDLTFRDKASEWGLDEPSFSNGAAYGDLDGDGDLDLVVNNVNMPCFVYRNNATEQHPQNKYLTVSLRGEGLNRFGIGSKVTVHYNGTLAYQEQMPMRGFESTVDCCLSFGLGVCERIDSVVVQWSDGRRSVERHLTPNQHLVIRQGGAGGEGPAESPPAAPPLFTAATTAYGLSFVHQENDYVDFDREKLLFQMRSTQGPRLAKGDVNGDGREDLYVCGAKDQPGALYLQNSEGRFVKSNEAVLAEDKGSEDVDALFFDADGDGDQDLYVCSGGSEFSPQSTALLDRLYLNDGKGGLRKSSQLLPAADVFESTSCVRAADYDGDGDLDLFVGVRERPLQYGYPCKSYLLQNNGRGVFVDVTARVAPALLQAGLTTDAQWLDYDRDGKVDLVLCGEYMPLRLLHNEGGRFGEVGEGTGLGKTNGWWNRLVVADVNGDGYMDLLAGNHGLNSRFRASAAQPVCLYVSDFDENGSVEQVVTCYNGAKAYPMALRHDLVNVLPYLKKKYLKYADYKLQTIEEVFTAAQLKKAVKLESFELRSCVFLNNGKGGFEKRPLPAEAQLSPLYAIALRDVDGDGKVDLIGGGNLYESKPEVGIYDAMQGVVLHGDGRGGFRTLSPGVSGLQIRGAVRDLLFVASGKKHLLLAAKNNEPLEVMALKEPVPVRPDE